MEKSSAVGALSALAQDRRLDVFRLLVSAGPGGLAAGRIASELGVPGNTLTFHLDRLRVAGLVSQRRQSRSIIYAADYGTINGLIAYLTENCCAGSACSVQAVPCDPGM